MIIVLGFDGAADEPALQASFDGCSSVFAPEDKLQIELGAFNRQVKCGFDARLLRRALG